MGKLLASLSVLGIVFATTLTYILILVKYFGASSLGAIGAGYLGLFLLAVAFLAFGIWISTLTSDQATSALGTVGGILLFWIVSSFKLMVPQGILSTITEQLSMAEHFQNFVKGLIDTHDIVFFLVFIIFFVFLTVQMLEIRKWKG
jgi:ABC-2 type transport system permease protein